MGTAFLSPTAGILCATPQYYEIIASIGVDGFGLETLPGKKK